MLDSPSRWKRPVLLVGIGLVTLALFALTAYWSASPASGAPTHGLTAYWSASAASNHPTHAAHGGSDVATGALRGARAEQMLAAVGHAPPAHALLDAANEPVPGAIELQRSVATEERASMIHPSVAAIRLTPADEAFRSQLQLVPLQVWEYHSHCGGARLAARQAAALEHGGPAKGQRLYIKRGATNDPNEPVLMSIEADEHGIVHVPHLSKDIATLKAPPTSEAAVPTGGKRKHSPPLHADLLSALPSFDADSTYCILDLDADTKQQAMIAAHKLNSSPHLKIDYACMAAKFRRCLHVLNLIDPHRLESSPPKVPFQGLAERKKQLARQRAKSRRKGADANAEESIADDATLDSPDIVRPVAIISIRHPCRGRGECEQWTGPRPK
jgi:hypothetical protein